MRAVAASGVCVLNEMAAGVRRWVVSEGEGVYTERVLGPTQSVYI